MKTTFVYCPKSGDRVFAATPTTSLVVVKYSNWSRHIVGSHIILSYQVAEQGDWWRREAKNLASSIIAAFGGVAWDECGTLNLAVPNHEAWAAYWMMRMAECDRHSFRGHEATDVMKDYNLLRLVQEGLATLKRNEKEILEGQAVWHAQDPIVSVSEEEEHDGTRVRKYVAVRVLSGQSVRVTAPWDITEIDGISPVEEALAS